MNLTKSKIVVCALISLLIYHVLSLSLNPMNRHTQTYKHMRVRMCPNMCRQQFIFTLSALSISLCPFPCLFVKPSLHVPHREFVFLLFFFSLSFSFSSSLPSIFLFFYDSLCLPLSFTMSLLPSLSIFLSFPLHLFYTPLLSLALPLSLSLPLSSPSPHTENLLRAHFPFSLITHPHALLSISLSSFSPSYLIIFIPFSSFFRWFSSSFTEAVRSLSNQDYQKLHQTDSVGSQLSS